MKAEICEITYIDEQKVENVKGKLKEHNISDVVQIFKVLSDETRLKIAYALKVEDELCVCDVANIVGTTVATASHHLRLLKNLRLAKNRKEGKLVYYSLHDERIKQIIEIAFFRQQGGFTNE